MKTTTQEFADRLSISYTEANGLLRSFVTLGLAEKAGTIKEPGKRGKGKSVFLLKRGLGERLDTIIFDAEKDNGEG